MKHNKDHWYDGLFYDKVIAPNQDRAYRIVSSLISKNSSILDAGCGTGRMAFKLKGYSRYDGIDLSARNIETAVKNLSKNPSDKISFHHSSLQSYLTKNTYHYDYAVISYVIHEVNAYERENILLMLSEAADKVIIIDYLYPRPSGFLSLLNEAVEFMAGKEHYRNFKTYMAQEGVKGLAERTGLKVIREFKPSTIHIAVLSKP